jgi:hypothetical protein
MHEMAADGSDSRPAAAIPGARQQKGRREAGLLSFK